MRGAARARVWVCGASRCMARARARSTQRAVRSRGCAARRASPDDHYGGSQSPSRREWRQGRSRAARRPNGPRPPGGSRPQNGIPARRRLALSLAWGKRRRGLLLGVVAVGPGRVGVVGGGARRRVRSVRTRRRWVVGALGRGAARVRFRVRPPLSPVSGGSTVGCAVVAGSGVGGRSRRVERATIVAPCTVRGRVRRRHARCRRHRSEEEAVRGAVRRGQAGGREVRGLHPRRPARMRAVATRVRGLRQPSPGGRPVPGAGVELHETRVHRFDGHVIVAHGGRWRGVVVATLVVHHRRAAHRLHRLCSLRFLPRHRRARDSARNGTLVGMGADDSRIDRLPSRERHIEVHGVGA
mmetsp:Transcript_4676/g.13737  ORF Transcript_4676/g.13737 Transcript_4676/m.13737 type:complete len:355 (+) Transcript_4676:518-1582(+)